MNKNPFLAFLLAFFPGGGLMYLGRVLRGLFYTLIVFGIPIFGIAIVYLTGIDAVILSILFAMVVYFINFVDTTITASKLYKQPAVQDGVLAADKRNQDSLRFFTIILSFIPGLGHFQLGLVYRGMTLLAGFFGAAIMIIFISLMTGRGEFLIFLAFLAVIWFYGLFDALKQLEKKENGEPLEDTSILEELENRHRDGRKSKALATLLSIFPGAGHLYLGMQKRGIQLMAAFLLSIYILDVLRLSIFLIVIPIIWFYSFFDGLQKASKSSNREILLEDEPVVSFFVRYQKWIGIGLIFLGVYYIAESLLIPVLDEYVQRYFNTSIHYWFYDYAQKALVCLILIVGGFKLMVGKKTKETTKEGEIE